MNGRVPLRLALAALVLGVIVLASLLELRPDPQPAQAPQPAPPPQPATPVAPTSPPAAAVVPTPPLATSVVPSTSQATPIVPTPPPTAQVTPPRPAAAPVTPTRPVPTGFMEQTSRAHPRQRFYLYVPRSYDGRNQFHLLVVMHGSERRAEEYAEEFTAFADEHRYVILAPLFPRGERFDLFGFSGGGQFAHRFLYVHPERLRSVVAAAPGTVALPTDRYRWPYGVADLGKLAKVRFDLDEVRRIRAMLIVGEEDVEDENLNESDEANRFGRTRLKRARTLHEAWQEAGIRHEYVEVADVGHELNGSIVRRAARFLAGGR